MSAALIKHEQITTTYRKAREVASLCREADHAGEARRPLEPPSRARPPARRRAACEAVSTSLRRATPRATAATPASSKAGFRRSDAAPIAVIELVDRDVSAKGQDSGPVMTDEDEYAEA
jgi:hypothetical protein